MDKNEEFKLTGPEFQTELLKRMEYRDESPRCGDCKHFSLDLNLLTCILNPVMTLNISSDGYCVFYDKA